MIYTNFPLNLNLIIPFKDKKGIWKNRLLLELNKYEGQLHQRVIDLKAELLKAFKVSFGLSIAKRAGTTSNKYYWRMTSRNSKRTYNRLFDEPILKFLEDGFSRREVADLKKVENELILINANLRLVYHLKGSIKDSERELKDNHEIKLPEKFSSHRYYL